MERIDPYPYRSLDEMYQRRRELTEKLKKDELSVDEAKELCKILEKEYKMAIQENDPAAVAIGLLHGIVEAKYQLKD